jgi:hypothetical protein
MNGSRAQNCSSFSQGLHWATTHRQQGDGATIYEIEWSHTMHPTQPDKNVLKKIGSPGMQGLGPGNNLRKAKFDLVKKNVKTVHDQLKAHPAPNSGTVDQYLHYLGQCEKDMELYCKDVPGAKPFHDNFVGAAAGLKNLKQAKVAAGGVPRLLALLDKLANATYAKAPNEA